MKVTYLDNLELTELEKKRLEKVLAENMGILSTKTGRDITFVDQDVILHYNHTKDVIEVLDVVFTKGRASKIIEVE